MLYALQCRDDPYLEIVREYNNDQEQGNRDIDLFCEAFHQLQHGMASTDADLLGVVYEECGMTSDAFGQYFTPHPVSKAMAEMQIPESLTQRDEPYRVADPACGSGRLLIEAAKRIDAPTVFYGQDKDSTRAKMAALNLCFFNIDGVAVLGDSLTLETRKAWRTQHSPLGGSVREVDGDDIDLPSFGDSTDETQQTTQLQFHDAISG